MKYNPDGDWKQKQKQKQKQWFRSARYEADEKLKGSDQKLWKEMKTKRLEDQIKDLNN